MAPSARSGKGMIGAGKEIYWSFDFLNMILFIYYNDGRDPFFRQWLGYLDIVHDNDMITRIKQARGGAIGLDHTRARLPAIRYVSMRTPFSTSTTWTSSNVCIRAAFE